MSEKRMFTQKIIDSDPFLDMPLSTQALYFHLNMRADDDGFINNPKKIQRMIGASEDDLKLLILKRFVIGFESGVIVIKHWRMHNTLKSDRYRPTQYQDELAMLDIKENKSYTERVFEPELPSAPPAPPALPEPPAPPKPPKRTKSEEPTRAYGEFGWVKLTDTQYARLLEEMGEAELKRCIDHVDRSAQKTTNKNKWKDWNLVVRCCHREGWGLKPGMSKLTAEAVKNAPSAEDEMEQMRRMYAHTNGGAK